MTRYDLPAALRGGLRRRRVAWGIALVALGYVVISFGSQLLAATAGANLTVYTNLIGALCCSYVGLRGPRVARLSWLLFALVLLLYAGADTLWLVYGGAEGNPPILSVADALYLLALVPAVIALVLYPAARGWRGTLRPLLFDAAVLGAAALLISYVLVFDEVIRLSESGGDLFLLLVYPVTDVALVCLVLLVLIRSVGQPRPDLALIGLCFATYAVADNGYALLTVRGQDSLGTVVDLGYILAPLLLGWAAIRAGTRPRDARTMQRHLTGIVAPLFPDLSTIAALTFFVALEHNSASSSWVLAATALALTGVRQLALTVDRQRVRNDLEERIAMRTEELRELTEAQARLDAMKSEFVSGVSHELRTPLTAIHAALEMLADGDAGPLPGPAQGVVEVAHRGTRRLARLVDDIIDLERLDHGTFSFRPQPEPLAPLLADAVSPLASIAQSRGITLVLEPTTQSAHCDADRIIQALMNLVGNALKFTPSGGRVTVSTTAPAGHPDDLIVIAVTDEGRGIPPNELEVIFERFHQVRADDDRTHTGAGLGLTITKHIVRAHGGRIWAENNPGVGSTFSFTLPGVQAGEHQPITPSAVDTTRV